MKSDVMHFFTRRWTARKANIATANRIHHLPSLSKQQKLYLPTKRDVKQNALFLDNFTQKNTKRLRNILSWILRNFVLREKPNTIVIIYHTFVVTTII